MPLRQPSDLSDVEWQKLRSGGPVMHKIRLQGDEGMEGWILMEQSPAHVWTVLTDYERFADWQAGIKNVTTVTWPSPTVALVGFQIPSPLRDVTYTLRREHKAQESVRWSRYWGDLERIDGGYDFFPQDGGTLLRYFAIVDIGIWVPAFVREHFENKGLTQMLLDIRNESTRRAAAATPRE
jgi:predicted DCC family thiol-disulfide oxidoreductase YuxK